MKKILSLVLVAVMVMGMASVAFAASKAVKFNMNTSAYLFQVNDDGLGKYKGAMLDGKLPAGVEALQPGKTYYISFWITDDVPVTYDSVADVFPVTVDTSLAKKYKVYPEWKQGSMSNITIESRKVELINSSSAVNGVGYRYVLVVSIPDSTTTKINDLNGVLKIGTSTSDAKAGTAFDLQASYGYIAEVEGNYVYNPDKPIMDFADNDTDVDLTWADVAEFSVNVSGQGKLLVKYSTSFDAAFAAKYDYANLDFIKFNAKPSFNRTGVLRIFADEDTYIYEVTADGAKEINATYVGDAWEFKTRTLGTYVISDSELKLEAEAPAPTEPAPTETTKPNPNTGR